MFLFFLCARARVARAVVAVEKRWMRRVASVIARVVPPGRDDGTRRRSGGDARCERWRLGDVESLN